MIQFDRVAAAAERVQAYLRPTPLLELSPDVHLKLECLQPTGSFKVRGLFAAATARPRGEIERGLVTVSAGNAALGAAYVARKLGVPCRVYMYETAPAAKRDGTRALGAETVLWPREKLLEWMENRGWEAEAGCFIHSFADEELIAGHAVLGMELARQLGERLARVVVPVGGGGLVTGVASAVKHLRPGVEVVGAQSTGYPLWERALAAGGPVRLQPETIADGTTAPFDARMFERVRAAVDRWVLVPEPRLRVAVAELAGLGKVVAEGAGALAFAALDQLEPRPGTVAVVSGGNIDQGLLAELLRR